MESLTFFKGSKLLHAVGSSIKLLIAHFQLTSSSLISALKTEVKRNEEALNACEE